MPTKLWSSQLSFCSAHWDLALADWDLEKEEKDEEEKATLRKSKETLTWQVRKNENASNNFTKYQITAALHPSISTPSHLPTFLHSSTYLLLALQDFTTSTRKSQHLQSGFRLLLSLRLFLQALLAICSFFRFCYSCLYRVRLDLQWQEWRRWIEFPGSHWNPQSQYVTISSTAGNTSEQPAEQTLTNLQYIRVLHLGWSSMCFTALVGLVDSQMLQTVLCFFILPGCSSASQTSQLKIRSGRHHDSCKCPKWFCEGTFICNGWDCHIKWHPFPRLPFPMSNLVCSLKIGFVTAMVLPANTSAPLLAPSYTFWQAKPPKPLPLKQLHTLKYTQSNSAHSRQSR